MLRKLPVLVALAALLTGTSVPAGTVVSTGSLVWNPVESSGPLGGDLVFTLRGVDFIPGTSGGDFGVEWNPAHLSFVSFVNANPTVFDSFTVDLSSVNAGIIVRGDVFKGSAGAITNFDVGTLTLKVLAGLASVDDTTLRVLASTSPFAVGWSDPDVNQIVVTYGTAQVSFVPAPPAVWLLLTAVGTLAARRIRRTR